MGEFNVNKSDGSLEQTAGMPSEYPATQVMMSDDVTSVEDALDGRMLRKKILTIPASTASGITGWYYGYAEYSTSVIPASAFILNAYSSLDAVAVPTMANITARPNNMVRVSGITAHDNSNVMVTVGWVDDFVSE